MVIPVGHQVRDVFKTLAMPLVNLKHILVEQANFRLVFRVVAPLYKVIQFIVFRGLEVGEKIDCDWELHIRLSEVRL
jgi:hypothetical protein